MKYNSSYDSDGIRRLVNGIHQVSQSCINDLRITTNINYWEVISNGAINKISKAVSSEQY